MQVAAQQEPCNVLAQFSRLTFCWYSASQGWSEPPSPSFTPRNQHGMSSIVLT